MQESERWAKDNLLVSVVAGSRLYGLAREDSDTDLRGVCYMPSYALLGLSPFEQYESVAEDTVIWGLTKFVRLALQNNPNILDVLFAPVESRSEDWTSLWNVRHWFLSGKVRITFGGYAISQLKRLEGHRKWLLNPPERQPVQSDFGGVEVKRDKGGAKWEFGDLQGKQNYDAAIAGWNQYQTWLKNRNPKRAAMERKCGYDTKHAGHLLRLLSQGIRILETGDYNPVLDEGQREAILPVLNGDMDYETLMFGAEAGRQRLDEVYTDLPDEPNRAGVENLLVALNFRSLYRSANVAIQK